MITLLHVGWKQYGDLRTYRSMGDEVAAQLANVAVQAAAGLGKMHTPYGDWCPPPEKMGGGQGPKPSEPLTSAFSYVTMVKHASELADASGDAAAAKTLDDLAAKLTDEYNAAFYHKESGSYDTGTQTALALGLAMGAAPDTKVTLKALRTIPRMQTLITAPSFPTGDSEITPRQARRQGHALRHGHHRAEPALPGARCGRGARYGACGARADRLP